MGSERLASNEYRLNDNSALEKYVDHVEATGKSRFITQHELDTNFENIDTKALIATLPPEISEQTFCDVLMLSMITECATDSFAVRFKESAVIHEQPWLERFNEKVWVPDEYSHATPFEKILVAMGYSESELQRRQKEAQEMEFEIGKGVTPVGATTYGTVQEYLTDNWHGLQAKILRESNPLASAGVARVKQRETLHTVWYRDMTAMQVEDNPELIEDVAESLVNFKMPGNVLIPDVQAQTPDLLPQLGSDLQVIKKDLIKLSYEMAAGKEHTHSELAGRLVFAITRQANVEPQAAFRIADKALNKFGRIGGWGYGLMGEAMLESAGVKSPFTVDKDSQNIFDSARNYIRTEIANLISNKSDGLFNKAA